LESRQVGRAAIRLAISESRDEESALKRTLRQDGILAVAVDFGGEYGESIHKVIERSLVAARREGVVPDTHVHQGAVAGACREALQQLVGRALGQNLGGKLAVARGNEHLAVAVYAGVGLSYLDDVAVAIAHRAVPAGPDGPGGAGGVAP
jgi:hypothetical protein